MRCSPCLQNRRVKKIMPYLQDNVASKLNQQEKGDVYRIQRLQDNNRWKCSGLYLITYSYSLNENYNSGEFCHHRLFVVSHIAWPGQIFQKKNTETGLLNRNTLCGQVCWCTSLIPKLCRQRQANCELEASLFYMISSTIATTMYRNHVSKRKSLLYTKL